MPQDDKTDEQLEHRHRAAAEGRALELIRRQLGATRELPTATDRFRESSEKKSKVLIVLTAVLVLLTVTLIGATVVLVVRAH
jgi:hypothetical protein